MNHIPFATTEFKEKNLRRLADYLEKLPDNYENFYMGSYCESSTSSFWDEVIQPQKSIEELKCGAVACAVGHAPAAGIGRHSKLDRWDDFSSKYLIDGGHYPNEWAWCFGAYWEHTDDTPKGAAFRILYLLDKGFPSNADYQQNGDASLSYY